MPADLSVRPDAAFLAEVEKRSGERVSLCYQCRRCTNGCPVTFAMDFTPNQVMRMIQLGLRDELFAAQTAWVCASCQTCTTRCPNDIHIARLMDTLRQMSVEAGVPPAEEKVGKFHNAFLHSVRRHGRVFELGMVMRYKLATRDLFSDAKMAWKLFTSGKLHLLPSGIRGKQEIREMFDKSEKG
jgi:heterodisulfide reductase subunit C